MGSGMVARLLAAGRPVTVLGHRRRAPVEAALALGAVEAADARALAGVADTVILCTRNAETAEAVAGALLPHLRPGTLVIDTGTAPPEVPRRLHERLAARGIVFAEAPLTGGVTQAAEGALGALVGACEADFPRVEAALAPCCATIRLFGPPGAAATAKLLNNYMVMGIIALITETFGRARAAGIDWAALYEVATRGSGDSGALRRIMGGAVTGEFDGYVFDVGSALKDLDYFRGVAADTGGASPLAGAVHAVFAKAVAAGHGDRLVGELLRPDLAGGITP
jgi:3-hydroxyisobutyrate dehydrogenase-like beta-hydroxyacid dehydrogenase